MAEVSSLSARAIAEEIAAGRLGAEEVVSACLDRIAAREAVVGAWHYLDRDAALADARRCDAMPPAGPLHGVPIAVKDLIDTVDMPTGYGSAIYEGHRPAADAACVALARAAGAIVLGKTVTTEFACFTAGKTANPRNPAHTPGGSSSGSAAAVADLMAPLALGTQTAGSVIRPAAFCGIVGFKPSFGVIPRAGVKMLADSLDTIGTMARNVADAAFLAGILGGRPALRHIAIPDAAPRFGLYRTPMWEEAEPSTAAALDHARAALEHAGARVGEVAVPPEHRGLTAAQDAVMGFELARGLAHERLTHSAELSPRLTQLLDAGMSVGADAYEAALAETAAARMTLDGFFGPCDAMLTPAAPGEAPQGLFYTGNPVFNRMWTLLGVPCVTLPALWSASGLPTGIQLVGRPGSDAQLLAAALFAERALAPAGWGGMSRRSSTLALALIGAAVLAGCNALEPYPTLPQPASAGATTFHRVAICYNRLATTLAAVQTEAQQECAADYPHSVAEQAETDWYLENCPLLLPERATFVCAAKRKP